MKPSKQLKAIKAKIAKYNGIPAPVTLTPELAYELLYNRIASRPISMEYAMLNAFLIRSGDANKSNLNPIYIIMQNNGLVQGGHLLAGFLLTGRKKLRVYLGVIDFNNDTGFYF